MSAARELIEAAGLKKGQILVVGCSTSEVCGSKIGTDSRPEVAVDMVEKASCPYARKKDSTLRPVPARNTSADAERSMTRN